MLIFQDVAKKYILVIPETHLAISYISFLLHIASFSISIDVFEDHLIWYCGVFRAFQKQQS